MVLQGKLETFYHTKTPPMAGLVKLKGLKQPTIKRLF